MKYIRYLGAVLLFLGLTTCVDPYDFDLQDNEQRNFVVEGYLSSVPGKHEIRVSRTTFIGEFNGVVADYVTSAKVSIIDDQGLVIPLEHTQFGVYETGPEAVALPGRSYKVRAEFSGRIYESSFETLTEELAISNDIEFRAGKREELNEFNNIREVNGVEVVANVQKASDNKFYRWKVDHYYIYESDLGPDLTFEEQEGLVGEELRFCFIKDYPFEDLHIHRDIASEQALGQNYQVDIEFIPIDKKFEYQFVIESTLLALPEKDYNFWNNIEKLAENTGGLFDAAPFSVVGNIRDITADTEEEATGLGYFGVYNAAIDRDFINPMDIGISGDFPDCTIPSPAPPRENHPCEDCRFFQSQINFENNPPAWWQYR